MSGYRGFLIANTALTGIPVPALFVTWILTLCLVRREGDPARSGAVWLHFALPAALLSAALGTVYGAMSSYDSDAVPYVSSAAFFLDSLASIIVVCLLAELALGFLQVYDAVKFAAVPVIKLAFARTIRIGTAAAAVIMFGIVAGLLASNETSYVNYVHAFNELAYNELGLDRFETDLDKLQDTLHKKSVLGVRLGTAFASLQFVISIALLAFAAFIVHKFRSVKAMGNTAPIFLGATIVWFFHCLWQIVEYGTWILPSEKKQINVSKAYYLTDPIFDVWLMAAVLIMAYVITYRKARGLWSTPRLWNNNLQPQDQLAQPIQQQQWPQVQTWNQQQLQQPQLPQQLYAGVPVAVNPPPQGLVYYEVQGTNGPYYVAAYPQIPPPQEMLASTQPSSEVSASPRPVLVQPDQPFQATHELEPKQRLTPDAK